LFFSWRSGRPPRPKPRRPARRRPRSPSRERTGFVAGLSFTSPLGAHSIHDPLGRTISLNWCGCGSLESLIDANGSVTRWVRDAENRVVQEVLADNTSRSVTYDPATSRVQHRMATGESV